MGKRRPTIYDVATRAGVSKSLVSLVLQGSPRVGEASRHAVRTAIAELGYRPSRAAADLAAHRTRTVGVLIDDYTNLWFVDLVRGLHAALGPAGYRLAVVDMALPPLRARPEDIPELMRHFMQQLAVQLGVPPLPLSHEVVSRLAGYSWPGNVRELRNYVERSLILGCFPPQPSAAPTAAPTPAGELELSLAEVERRHIERVTAACEGNKTEAARRLGVSRKTLERKFAEWVLEDAAAAPAERRA